MSQPRFNATLSAIEAKEHVVKIRRLRHRWPENRIQKLFDTKLAPHRHQDFRTRRVEKPNGATRVTYVATVEDQAMAYVVKPAWDQAWLTQGHGHEFGLGVGQGREAAIRNLVQYLEQRMEVDSTVLMTDIESFYDTVLRVDPEDVGVGEIHGVQLRAMFKAFDKVAPRTGVGVPQGSPLSPNLANLSLNKWVTSPFRKAYEGNLVQVYADDVCMVTGSQHKAGRMLGDWNSRLGRVGMKVAEQKTEIIPIRLGASFNYLGVEIRVKESSFTVGIPERAFRSVAGKLSQASTSEKFRQIRDGWLCSLSIINEVEDQQRALELIKSCQELAGIQHPCLAPPAWRQDAAAIW